MLKLSQEELQSLQELTQQSNNIIISLGELELQKGGLVEQYKILASQQNELAKSLTEKYGDGTINLETGEVTLVEGEKNGSPSSS